MVLSKTVLCGFIHAFNCIRGENNAKKNLSPVGNRILNG